MLAPDLVASREPCQDHRPTQISRDFLSAISSGLRMQVFEVGLGLPKDVTAYFKERACKRKGRRKSLLLLLDINTHVKGGNVN